MTDLEDALSRTFTHAAAHAPTAPADLVRKVGERHSRRRRGIVVASAAIVAVVTVGSTFTVRELASTSPPAGPATGVTDAPAPPTDDATAQVTDAPSAEESRPAQQDAANKPPPIKEVWPQAVHMLPATLPDGRKFGPQLFLDDHTLLVTTESSFEKADTLLSYDVETGKVTEVARIKTPARADIFPSDFVSGDGQVAWWTSSKQGEGFVVDIWAVATTGGTPHKVTSIPGTADMGGIDHLEIADGKATWSLVLGGGVYQAPLSGGRAEAIPGTEGMHLIQWPWAGSPSFREVAETSRADGSEPSGGTGAAQKAEPVFSHLLNVQTGERREANLDLGESPGSRWGCGITWCTGSTREGSVARRRDGSEERRLPGRTGGMSEAAALDRITVVMTDYPRDKRGVALYDLATGRSGDLGIRPASNGSMSFPGIMSGAQRLISYPLNGKLAVVDFAAIK
ncbi:hypothetical protein GCM10022226_24960 [Sphaerisporangium flaviroseum]|uniref:WD40 repeat domain-containing protein n=1 Tax=Sphaerisporangium flaviroseum TaxID=509199 RepID=A0ABP7I1R8_9ACTN